MSRPRRLAVAALLGLCLPVHVARAERSDAHHEDAHGRVFAAGSITGREVSLRVDDDRSYDEDGALGYGVLAGYEHGLLGSYVSIAGLGRVQSWPTAWSSGAGESRWRFEVAVAPVGAIPFVSSVQSTPMRVYGYAPVGLTVPWIEPGPRAGIREEYSDGWGVSYGLTLGWSVFPDKEPPHGGFFVELSLLVRRMWLTHTAETIHPPYREASERIEFAEREVGLSVGGDVWLF